MGDRLVRHLVRHLVSPTLRWALVGLLIAAVVVALEWNTISRAAHRPRAGVSPTMSAAPSDPTVVAPALGGTTEDFLRDSAYQLVSGSRGLGYTATIAEQRVEILLTLDDPSESLDGQAHIAIITVSTANHAAWSLTTADAIAETFLPADATGARTVTIRGVQEHIYHSDALAQIFTADQFTNDFGNAQVPVGTLSYDCHAWPPASLAGGGLGQCVITIGSY